MADSKKNTKLVLVLLIALPGLVTARPAPPADDAPASRLQNMALVVEPSQQPPTIDLAEILDDPKETRQRMGWMAALRVGMVVGMYYLQAESIKDQCQGSYCSALGVSDLQDMQLGMLQGDAMAQMTEIFASTVKRYDEASMEHDAVNMAAALDIQVGGGSIQQQLAKFTTKFVAATTDHQVLDPGSVDVAPTHQLKVGIAEVATRGNYANAGLAITLKGTAELVDIASGETVDSYSHLVKTPSRRQVDWTAGGAGVVAQDVVVAMARLSETLSEEVLMVVNSPSLKGKGYLMKPVAPVSNICMAFCKGKMWGNFGFKSEVGTHTPSLSWERFEDRYASDPIYLDGTELGDVQYDLRIYEAVEITRIMGDKIYGAGPLVQEIRGIESPEFTFEEPLPACERLVWTVRARFVADDARHLTRWSGHYKERQIERRRQDVMEGKGKFNDAMGALMGGADQSTSRQETSWYYGFRTPQLEGDKKCKWRG